MALRETLRIGGRVRLIMSDGDRVVEDKTYENTITYNGLTVLANSLAYAGINTIAYSIGYTQPVDPTPMYGAVGTGTTTPTLLDMTLTNEIGRAAVQAGFGGPASLNVAGSSNWNFYLGAPTSSMLGTGSTVSLTEAGIFANASAASGSGTLVNHALISPAFVWTVGYTLQLQVSLLFWADTDNDSK